MSDRGYLETDNQWYYTSTGEVKHRKNYLLNMIYVVEMVGPELSAARAVHADASFCVFGLFKR